MTEMTSEERVLCALQRKQPDRVPHFEWLVDRRVRESLCPGITDFNEFAVQMGQDAVIADPIFKKERVGANRWRSKWGYVSQDTNEEHGIEVESPIKSMAGSNWEKLEVYKTPRSTSSLAEKFIRLKSRFLRLLRNSNYPIMIFGRY